MEAPSRKARVRKRLTLLWVIALFGATLYGTSGPGGLAFGTDDGVSDASSETAIVDNASIDIEQFASVNGPTGPWHNGDRPDASVGADVFGRVVVKNTGDVALANLALTAVRVKDTSVSPSFYQDVIDAALGTSACSALPSTLGAGEAWECVYGPITATADLHESRIKVTADSVDADGNVVTLAIVDKDTAGYVGAGAPAALDPEDPTATGGGAGATGGAVVFSSHPAIDVEKEVSVDGGATWFDADSPSGPTVLVGANTVFFRFTVTNTGVGSLDNIALTDSDFQAMIDASCTIPSTLGAGGSATCVIGPIAAVQGQHANTAMVTATPAGQPPATLPPDGPEKYEFLFVFDNGAVASGVWDGGNEVDLADFSADIDPGDLSDVTHISCSDEFGFGNSDPDGWGEKGAPDIDNDPGWHLSGVQIRKDGDLCVDGGTTQLQDTDKAHYLGELPQPAIDLEKNVSVDGGTTWFDADDPTGPAATAGSNNVFFRFTVTNTGAVGLHDLELTDTDFQTEIDAGCNLTDPLSIGSVTECVIGPFVAQTGQHANTATVTAAPIGGTNVTIPLPGDGVREKGVVLFFENGQTVVGHTNGDVDIASSDFFPPASVPTLGAEMHLSCSDDFGFGDSDPTNDGWSESSSRFPNPTDHPNWRLRGAHIVKKYEGDRITPKEWCDDGDVTPGVSDSDDAHYIGQVAPPDISLLKDVSVDGGTTWFPADSPTGPTAVAGGNTVFFRFTVTNTGAETLENLVLTDTDFQVAIDATCNLTDPLAVGASTECTIGPFVAQVGQHQNKGTITATAPGVGGTSHLALHQASGGQYAFTFIMQDGQIVEGTSTSNEATVPGFSDNFHVSCSDHFGFDDPNDGDPDGWGEKGAPVFGSGDNGPIVDYLITKFESNDPNDDRIKSTCGEGNVTPQPQVVTDMNDAHYIGVARSYEFVKKTNGESAPSSAGPMPVLGAGDLVTWSYEVTNTGSGSVPLADIDLSDSVLGVLVVNGVNQVLAPPLVVSGPVGDTIPNGLLDPTETWVWTVTGGPAQVFTASGVAGAVSGFCWDGTFGSATFTSLVYENEATIDVDGVVLDDLSHYCTYDFELVKKTNGQSASSAVGPKPVIAPGDPVTWTYEVENTGNLSAALSDVDVNDDVLGDIVVDGVNQVIAGVTISGPTGDANGNGSFDPGETWVWTAVGIAEDPGLVPPPWWVNGDCQGNPSLVYENRGTATVIGTYTDWSHYCTVSYRFVKKTNGESAPSSAGPMPVLGAGDPVTWSYEVTNTGSGSVPLADISLDDSVLGVLVVNGVNQVLAPPLVVSGPVGDTIPNGLLDPTETWVWTVTGGPAQVFTASGVAGAVSGFCWDGTFGSQTLLSLVYENEATIDIDGVVLDDLSHYCTWDFEVLKKTNGEDAANPAGPMPVLGVGDGVTWSYDVINTGNLSIPPALIDVFDDVLGPIAIGGVPVPLPPPYSGVVGPFGDTIPNGLLDPGETWTYEAEGFARVMGAGIAGTAIGFCWSADFGSSFTLTEIYRNEVELRINGRSWFDESHHCVYDFEFDKKTNGQDADNAVGPKPAIVPGDPVTWTYEGTNSGNLSAELADISVDDDVLGDIVIDGVNQVIPGVTISGPTGDVNNDSLFNPGETWVWTAVGVAEAPGTTPPAWWVNGECQGNPSLVYENMGTLKVIGTYTDWSHYCNPTIDVRIRKFTNGQDANSANGPMPTLEPGDTVVWRYHVFNVGATSVPIADVTVTDNIAGVVPAGPLAGDFVNPGFLDPGETWVYIAVGTATVHTVGDPGIVTGTCDTVTNSPVYENFGRVTITFGVPFFKEDPSHYCTSAYSFEKLTNGQDADSANGPMPTLKPGDPVTWTYEVTNDGSVSVPAANIVVTDDVLGPIALAGVPVPPATGPTGDGNANNELDPGETWVYEYTGTASVINLGAPGAVVGTCAGIDPTPVYENTGLVTITLGSVYQIDDPSHYCTSSYRFKKLTNGQDANSANGAMPTLEPGDLVVWRYHVTNDGGIPVPGANVVVTDDILGPIAGPVAGDIFNLGVLDPGETWIYIKTGTAQVLTIGDPGAVVGTCQTISPTVVYENFGTVTITLGTGPVVLTDPSHYCTEKYSFEKLTNGQDADSANGPMPTLEPGDPVTWTYEVTNDGSVPVPLANISLSDDVLGALVVAGVNQPGVSGPAGDNANAVLDPGETWIYEVTGIAALLNPLSPGAVPGTCESIQPYLVYENIGTVTITTNGNTVLDDPSHFCTVDSEIHVEKFTERIGGAPNALPVIVVGEDADTPFGPFITAGGPVRWNYEVTNLGTVPIGNVVLTDDAGTPLLPGDDFNPIFVGGDTNFNGLLEPGEIWVYTTAIVPAQLGQYANIAEVTGDANGVPVDDDDPSHYYGVDPQIDIEKATNGQDADLPTGPLVPVGSTVTWTYVVTNAGNLPLANVVVTDDNGTPLVPGDDFSPAFIGGDTNGDGLLDPSETWTYESTGLATAGQYENFGAVEGNPVLPDSTQLSKRFDLDPSHYFGQDIDVRIRKFTNGQDANSANGPMPVLVPGQLVVWRYHVTNLGNTAIPAANVDLSDDILGPIAGPVAGDIVNPGFLDPSETWIYIETGTAQVVALGDPGAVVGTCQTVSPTVVYENFGRVDITFGTPFFVVDPSHYCTESYSFDKFTNGQDADDPNGPMPVLMPGDPVTWTYHVTNNGSVQVPEANISLTDSVLGALVVAGVPQPGVTGPTGDGGNGVLDPGETWVYETSGVATLIGTGPGAALGTCLGNSQFPIYENIGEVTIVTNGNTVLDDPSHYCTIDPQIDVEKATNGADADNPTGPFVPVGDPITWTYVVTNPGNVPLSGVVLRDNNGTAGMADDFNPTFLGGDGNGNGLLDPGETWTYQAVSSATAGQYMNLATATGTGAGVPVSDVDPSHYFGTDPRIHVEKSTNNIDADTPAAGPSLIIGQNVNWRYRVTNPGNLPLTNVTVVDDIVGAITNFVSGDNNGNNKLDPGEVWLYLQQGTVQDTSNMPNGVYANVGTATGEPELPNGNPMPPISDDDPSHYRSIPPSAINIIKTTNNQPGDDAETCTDGAVVSPGDTVTWRYQVWTAGPSSIANVVVTDDNGTPGTADDFNPTFVGGDTDNDGELDPGEIWLYEALGTAVAGFYFNVGDVDGTDLGTLTTVTADDASCYFGADPQIHIEKSTNNIDADTPAEAVVLSPGDQVVWRYVVTNPGNTPLDNVAVVDNRVGVISNFIGGDSNNDGLLDPGESWMYQFVDQANDTSGEPGGVYENIGTATGDPVLPNGSLGTPVSDDDPSHYVAATPTIDLQVTKATLDAQGVPNDDVVAGTDFEYSVTVENLGPADATGVVILDLLPARVDDPPYPAPFDQFPLFSEGSDGVGDEAFRIDVPDIAPFSERQVTQGATYLGYSAPAGVSCTYVGSVNGVRCDVGDLAAGDSVTVVFDLNMDPFARVRVWNRAWVYGNELETNLDKDDGEACQTTSQTTAWLADTTAPFPQPAGVGCNYTKKNAQPNAEVDLTIDKVDSKDPVSPGEEFDYIIDSTNNGPSGANFVFFTDELPPEVDFVSASANCVYDAGSHTVECDLGAMGPNTSKSRTITVRVKAGVTGTIFNEVTIESREPNVVETNPNNNKADEPTLVLVGAIGDFVWHDLNADGIQDAGEPGIDAVTLTIVGPSGNAVTQVSPGPTDVTSGGGGYLFVDLNPGSYTVAVDLGTVPAGFEPTTVTSMDVTIGLGESFLDADFGFVARGSIGDFFWEDANDNGTFDTGEAAIAGAPVTLNLPGGGTLTTTTDANGLYLFDDLPPGDYEVIAPDLIGPLVIGLNNPAGTYTVVENVGAVYPVALAPGEDFLDADFGYVAVLATPQLGNFVWLDTDGDGIQDASEVGIAGARVTITGPAGTVVATTGSTLTVSNIPADGGSQFENYRLGVTPGTYTVTVDTSSVASSLKLTTVGTYSVTLADGESFLGADFGFAEKLPETGLSTDKLGATGLVLLIIGAFLLLAVRRREQYGTVK